MLSIRKKLILSALSVSAAVFAVELLYLQGPLGTSIGKFADESARRLCAVLADRLEASPDFRAEAGPLVHRLAPEIGRRITILDSNGNTIADSESEAGEYHFVSQRFPANGPLRGFVRVGVPLERFAEIRERQLRSTLIAGVVGLGFAFVLGLALAELSLRTLSEVAAAAEAIGGGELGRRAPIRGDDLVARIARNLNALAEQHQQKLLALARDRGVLLPLLDALVEGVVVVDRDGKVLASNGRFRELVLAPASPEGRKLGEVMNDAELEAAICATMTGSAQTGRTAMTTTRRRARPPTNGDAPQVDVLAEEALALRVRTTPIELPGVGAAAICLVEPIERAKDELQAEVARLLDESPDLAKVSEQARASLDLALAALDIETSAPEPEVLPASVYGGAEGAPAVFAGRRRLELALELLRLERGKDGGPKIAVEPTRVALELDAPPPPGGRAGLARRLAYTALRAAGGSIERAPDGRIRALLPRA